MWQTLRNARGKLLLALFLLGASAAQAQDPVDELKQALPLRLDESGDIGKPPSADILKYRRDALQKRVDGLKTMSQLRRALVLDEWKEDPTRHDTLRKLDAEMREQIGQRLTKAIAAIVESGDSTSKLAVANMIAEMGPGVRGVDGKNFGFTHSLAPLVKTLVGDKDLAVRQEALRALGNINAAPKDVVPILKETLEKDGVGPRRLAADALSQFLRVGQFLQKTGRASGGGEVFPVDALEAGRLVTEAAAAGLHDADAQVRALCLRAMAIAAEGLGERIPDAINRKEFPPEGRKLTDDEAKYVQKRLEMVKGELADLTPGLQLFAIKAPAIVEALRDSDVVVRLTALNTLESAADTRLRLRRRVLSVPSVTGSKDEEVKAYLTKNDPLEPVVPKELAAIATHLTESDTRLRRATLDFLELLEDDAAPVLEQVAAALADPDRFVRWGAARVIALLPSDKAASAVPYLARLMSDFDINIRMSAARALYRMGPQAKDAAPALAVGVAQGDAEPRVEIMRVVQQLNPEDAAVCVAPLADCLKHPDPRIRRGAAETLGKLGAVARPAVPALRRALGDEDTEVRVNTSDALLSILRPGKL